MKSATFRIVASLVFLAASSIAWAQEKPFEPEPLFGPEFEFRDIHGLRWAKYEQLFSKNFDFLSDKKARALSDRYYESRNKALERARQLYPTLSSGNRIKWGYDPYIIEVGMDPEPLDVLEAIASEAQQKVFGTMAQMHFYPPTIAPGGHVNIDLLSSFDLDEEHPTVEGLTRLLNFMVDYVIHDFSFGTFLYDPMNAIPYRLTSKSKAEFESKVIQIQEFITKGDVKTAQRLIDNLFERRGYGKELVLQKGRVEIRAIRSQKDFQEFVDYATIFRARIRYLHKTHADGSFVSPIAPGPYRGVAAFHKFYSYLDEAGLWPWKYDSLVLNAYNVCNILLTPHKWFPKLPER